MNLTYIAAALFAVGYFTAAVLLVRGVKLTTRALCVSGLMIALTVILESIYIPLPTGNTIPLFSPVPLMTLALLYDRKIAILSGWICGVLLLILVPSWTPVHWAQFFVEHMIAVSCLGFTGAFGHSPRWKAIGGVLLASCLRLLSHTISGVLFYSENAWAGWGAWVYSLTYNLSQVLPLCLLSGVIVLSLPMKSLRRVLGADKAK